MKSELEKALNDQLNSEFIAGSVYLSMSAYFESKSLDGFALWMFNQYKEENEHAMKFFHYLNARGCRAKLGAIPAPQQEWSSPLTVLEASLEYERKVTTRINELVDLSIREKDHATHQFLQWYVAEQVEEEATLTRLVDKLRLVQDSLQGVFWINREIGELARR